MHMFISRSKTSNITLLMDDFGSDNVIEESKKVITISVRLVVTPSKGGVSDQK